LGETFIISRIDIKKILTKLGISDKSIEELLSSMNKMHRHVNVVSFASMLQKLGLKQQDITNVLRRMGIEDIAITSVLNILDEEKIRGTLGRVVDLDIE
jgi:hypothetical protein